MGSALSDGEGRMSKKKLMFFSGLAVLLAMALMIACGSNGGGPTKYSSPTGSVVTFGSDAPICDVESFSATITSMSLTPQGSGSAAPLISSTAPAMVDFARLADFTN